MCATLHNWKQVLGVIIFFTTSIKLVKTSVEPAVGKIHAFFCIIKIAAARWTFIKSHNYIGTNTTLYIHYSFRGKQMPAAIYMTLKCDSFLFYFSCAC